MNPEEIEKFRYRGLIFVAIGISVIWIGFEIENNTGIQTGLIAFIVGFILIVGSMSIYYKNFIKTMKSNPKEMYKKSLQPWEKDE